MENAFAAFSLIPCHLDLCEGSGKTAIIPEFIMFGSQQPLGRLARWHLKAIPKTVVLPVLSGPNRGLWWVTGTSNHGCWLGSYEKPCVKYVELLVQPGMTVFDVGANVGYYTLLLARGVGPKGRVIAFEPNPINIAHLKKTPAPKQDQQCRDCGSSG